MEKNRPGYFEFVVFELHQLVLAPAGLPIIVLSLVVHKAFNGDGYIQGNFVGDVAPRLGFLLRQIAKGWVRHNGSEETVGYTIAAYYTSTSKKSDTVTSSFL